MIQKLTSEVKELKNVEISHSEAIKSARQQSRKQNNLSISSKQPSIKVSEDSKNKLMTKLID